MDELNIMSEALRLAGLGWHLFPTKSGDKRPLTGLAWRAEATTDPAKLAAWFGSGSRNLACAIPEGAMVLDIDPDGLAEFGGLAEAFDGPKARTPRGGWHLYCRAPEGVIVKNQAGQIAPGLDTRTIGGYVVAAPSTIDGRRYEWAEPLAVSPADLPACPGWLADRLRGLDRSTQEARESSPRQKSRQDQESESLNPPTTPKPSHKSYGETALRCECAKVNSAPEGTRNNQLNESALKVARLVAGGHLDESDARGALLEAALAAGLDERESAATIVSGFREGLKHPRTPAPRGTATQSTADEGNEELHTEAEWIDFPTDLLPSPIREYVTLGANAIGCSSAYIANPLLALIGAAAGTTRCLEVKRTWREFPILWALNLGESGTAKTPALEFASAPAMRAQAAAFAEHDREMKLHEAELQDYEAAVAQWKKGKCERPEKPPEPPCTRYVIKNATIEAVAPIMLDNPRGVTLVADELATWLGSFDRYRASGGGDSAHWLSLHKPQPLIVDRRTAKRLHVPLAVSAVTGGIQPGVLKRSMTGNHTESGLLARLLVCHPPRERRIWRDDDIDVSNDRRVNNLFEALYRMQHAEPDYLDSEGKPPAPIVVTMSEAARSAWVEFYNYHNTEAMALGGAMAAAWSKLEGYALRLSLIHHLIRVASQDGGLAFDNVLDAESMEAGIGLAGWYANEARRVYRELGASSNDAGVFDLLGWVLDQGGGAKVRDLMRAKRYLFPTSEKAVEAMQKLVDDGLAVWTSDRAIHLMPEAMGAKLAG